MADIEDVLPAWRLRAEGWLETSAHTDWGETTRRRRESREALLDWLKRLRGRKETLEELRVEFDQRTRTEWADWGMKGTSGAMFLNMLAKHLSDHDEVVDKLLSALAPAPASAGDAGDRIREFTGFLQGRIASGDAKRAQVHPKRAAFFLSSWWNVQDAEVPVYWRSALAAFVGDGLLTRVEDRAADYKTFHYLYRALCEALELSAWELEGICWWMEQRPAKAPEPPDIPPAGPEPEKANRVWLIAPGEGGRLWEQWKRDGIAAIGWEALGDLRQYETLDQLDAAIRALRGDGKNPHHDVRCCWDFSREMREGDLVFAKRGRKKVIAAGRVRSDYRHEPERGEYHHVRTVEWTHIDEKPIDRFLVTKTLTDITGYASLRRLLAERVGLITPDEEPEPEGGEPTVAPYTRDDALAELFLDGETLDGMLALLRRKRNLVLQGPPGTGKTFVASRLARLIVGGVAPEQVERVQFHQSMTYEDFVQGYRPASGGGFERRDGPFLRFCNLALQDQGSDYVLLIDEINRGNLSRILGELMILIEPDKRSRDWGVTLSYADEGEEPFWVPPNLYIVGTMNTADRSLALVDYALRRRFAFVDVPSAVRTDRFAQYLAAEGVSGAVVGWIRGGFDVLNREIAADPNLGEGFRVGHSYFCQPPPEGDHEVWYQQVIESEIAPLLREYWIDDPTRVEAAVERLLEMP